ncbi:MAG: metallophosphoesterase [Chloroflexi bacterium]|nr:metallophosphoesterase [Chloroflexota bacterium]
MWLKPRLTFVVVTATIGLLAFFYTLAPTNSTGLAASPRAVYAGAAIVRVGIIGDFGLAGPNEANVANLVKSWQPDAIVTLGDNNYFYGEEATIDDNIGQYYHQYIYPYKGGYGSGAPGKLNRFFPALGNHDWPLMTCKGTSCTGPYFDYFTLPNNERYYDFVQGPIHFFVLDSDEHEPDGITSTSIQANWLHEKLTASLAPWKLVLMHHSPYSSGAAHGSAPDLQWPYAQWGATAVLSGHNHNYERMLIDGLPYFVNGLGGAEVQGIKTPIPGSIVQYNDNYGAMLVAASAVTLTFEFVNVANTVIDSYSLTNTFSVATPTPLPPPTSDTPMQPFYLPFIAR